MRAVAILGSTGSIGTQALDVIARHPQRFRVTALAAGANVALLEEQIAMHKPLIVSVADADAANALRAKYGDSLIVEHGARGLAIVAAESGANIVLAATDGAVSFDAIFAAVDRGIDIAVANKELVVAAGELLFAAAAASGAKLLPVDSEHSALFQCLVGEPPERVASLVLTASGGPFWTVDAETMRKATPAQALRHPTWTMGAKNTIDSASMMNKGLEVIEASRFFDMPGERIHTFVHRTSVAHGFAIFTDGQVKGQFAHPDMRLPIGYALAYPDRLADRVLEDPLLAVGGERGAPSATLVFERPDLEKFPCLALAYAALKSGGTAPAALSAANEIAVASFLRGEILFGEIPELIAAAIRDLPVTTLSLDAVRDADRLARTRALEAVGVRAVERTTTV